MSYSLMFVSWTSRARKSCRTDVCKQ